MTAARPCQGPLERPAPLSAEAEQVRLGRTGDIRLCYPADEATFFGYVADCRASW